jgi:hypothetical protein
LKSTYKYSIFGLNFESDIKCPELAVAANIPDVKIRYGKVPESLGPKSHKGVCFEALPGSLLIKTKDIARYLITEGREIIIEPEKEENESSIRLFLLGSAMGALLHQRGILPLHGNGILFHNKGVLFAGISGAGKSTLAAMMALKGFEPVTDDITAIGYMNETPVILPGIPQLKLWQDSILKMNLKTKGLKKVRDELEKYYYPVKGKTNNVFVPLKKIYIMNMNNQEGIAIKPLNGIEKFTVLKNHTYRYNYVKSMNLEKSHFELSTRLASKIEISRLFRGRKGFDAGELADAVIEDLNK